MHFDSPIFDRLNDQNVDGQNIRHINEIMASTKTRRSVGLSQFHPISPSSVNLSAINGSSFRTPVSAFHLGCLELLHLHFVDGWYVYNPMMKHPHQDEDKLYPIYLYPQWILYGFYMDQFTMFLL